jgi:NAD-dependent SIR2 family protein deacetylase
MANENSPINYRIGFKKVSTTQREYLERAQHALRVKDVSAVFTTLQTVIRDKDIVSGAEEILPEWVQVYESSKSDFQRVLHREAWLELEKAFKSLQIIDKAAFDLNFSKLKASFLLGAGASKPNPSNIPTVKELLPELFLRARKLDREDLDKLATFCEQNNITNIEDLLTAAQLATFSSRNPAVMQLINFLLFRADQEDSNFGRRRRITAGDLSSVAFLQDTLQVLFGLLSSTMLPAKPNEAHKAIAEYAKKHPGTGVVTTNYDCCMDLALGNEGTDYTYGLDFTNAKDAIQQAATPTRLVKLHGSLNWFYCETCQEVQMTNIRLTVKNFLEDNEPYPVIGICKDCGGQRRGLLVPPLAMKFDLYPPLLPLNEQAAKTFYKSDVIIVVGFSFADADVYITRMVSKSMQNSKKQKLVIIDPDNQVTEKVRRRFKSSISNFDLTRIISVSGDCAEMLPKLLTGLLKTEVARVETPTKHFGRRYRISTARVHHSTPAKS